MELVDHAYFVDAFQKPKIIKKHRSEHEIGWQTQLCCPQCKLCTEPSCLLHFPIIFPTLCLREHHNLLVNSFGRFLPTVSFHLHLFVKPEGMSVETVGLTKRSRFSASVFDALLYSLYKDTGHSTFLFMLENLGCNSLLAFANDLALLGIVYLLQN